MWVGGAAHGVVRGARGWAGLHDFTRWASSIVITIRWSVKMFGMGVVISQAITVKIIQERMGQQLTGKVTLNF